MTPEEFAAKITGRNRGNELTKEEDRQAKDYGLVVVFGESDDLVEFRGSIDDELSIYINACRNYFLSENSREIIALWNDDDMYAWAWTYETDIPHATFEIYDNEPFCRGIVFSVKELP